uniref:Uncharacterized protein n=1 Tax=Cannabis sativa TaxID=3483 RepID=A0A803PPN7_CANSA
MVLTRMSVSIEPQDPMDVDPNVQAPPTGDNPANLAWSPRANPSAGFRPKGLLNVGHDPTSIHYRENGPRVGQPGINESQVDLDDSELARLRKFIGQVQGHTNILHHEQEETRVAVNDAFAQQRREFQEWMDRHVVIIQAHQSELKCQNRQASRTRAGRVNPTVQAQLDQLKSLIQGLSCPKLSNLELDKTRGSSFSTRINVLPQPTKFQMPNWKMYTTKEDPLAQIKYFEIQMDLRNMIDDTHCRIFPATLSETIQ